MGRLSIGEGGGSLGAAPVPVKILRQKYCDTRISILRYRAQGCAIIESYIVFSKQSIFAYWNFHVFLLPKE